MVDDLLYTDQGLVSARYYFPAGGPIPASVGLAATEVLVSGAGGRSRVFVLGDFDLDEHQGASLQDSFNAAVGSLLSAIRAIGLSRDQLEAVDGKLYFDLALVPDSGNAGIFLGRDELAVLAAAGANVLVSAWPGASWFDAKYGGESSVQQE